MKDGVMEGDEQTYRETDMDRQPRLRGKVAKAGSAVFSSKAGRPFRASPIEQRHFAIAHCTLHHQVYAP